MKSEKPVFGLADILTNIKVPVLGYATINTLISVWNSKLQYKIWVEWVFSSWVVANDCRTTIRNISFSIIGLMRKVVRIKCRINTRKRRVGQSKKG